MNIHMAQNIEIYMLVHIMDDPRYEGFASKGRFLDGNIPRDRKGLWKKKLLSPGWDPPEVIGRVRKYNDFPAVCLMPAFSERAINALGEFLKPNGELLPLKSNIGIYMVFNLLTVVDALDTKSSKVTWLQEPDKAFEVTHYSLIEQKLKGEHIFHLRETGLEIYVSDKFKACAEAYGLRGMKFQKVWPLSESVDWRSLKSEPDTAIEDGSHLPRPARAQALIIRLFLLPDKSSARSREKKQIQALLDALDRELYDPDGDRQYLGSLEGHDYGAPGECRIFLSSPDAETLFKKVRPILEQLHWKSEIPVALRDGNFSDAAASEWQVVV